MSRPRFPTVAWEVNQARHELAQATNFRHDRVAACWCCCRDCSATHRRQPAQRTTGGQPAVDSDPEPSDRP